MKIDGATTKSTPTGCAAEAAEFEEIGLDAAWTFETAHDPFLPLALAAERTDHIELGTAIAVAFARAPMTCAVTAWDLQAMSGGRLILGLGTQIRPHITKRYSQPWSKPAERMKEFIQALHAIWDTFQTGEPMQFRGEFYTHTLMTPIFNPGPLDVDRPKVYVAGVGPRMVEVVGQVADGFFVHPFHSGEFMATETLPALAKGAESAGRTLDDVTVAAMNIVAMGRTDEEIADARRKAAAQIAFYGSTPAYAGVLDHHGYEGLQPELNQLSKQGEWREMTERVDDELIDIIAVSGTPAEVGARLRERNAWADRTTAMFYGAQPDRDALAEMVAASQS